MSFNIIARRQFAGDLSPGDYAVPNLANPVSIDPDAAPYRSDFLDSGGKVAQVGNAFKDYWGGIWDIMTGNTDAPAENFTQEEKAQLNVDAGGDTTYFLMFAVAIGALYFLRKGGA